MKRFTIFCCGCGVDVQARLTDVAEIYPHRDDLHSLPFWRCDACGNSVGCHHKTQNPTRPLGCIPTNEIKKHVKKSTELWTRFGGLGACRVGSFTK